MRINKAKELDKDFIEKMKSKLLKEKATLEKELGSISKKNVHNSDDYIADFPNIGDEEDDNASEVATFGDNLALERNLEKTLRDVNSALKRIEDGTYGHCKYCNQLINPLRLKARPTSSSCIKCKVTLKNL